MIRPYIGGKFKNSDIFSAKPLKSGRMLSFSDFTNSLKYDHLGSFITIASPG
jgi:hypothetical protein